MEHFKRRTVAFHPYPRKCRQVRESHSRTVLLGCIWWERRHAGTLARRRGSHLFLLILKHTRTESYLCQKSKWKERNVVLLWNVGHWGGINTWSPLSPPPPHANKLCTDLPEILSRLLWQSSSEDHHLLFYRFSDFFFWFRFYLQPLSYRFSPVLTTSSPPFVVVLVVVSCCACDFRPTPAMKGNPAPSDKRIASK